MHGHYEGIPGASERVHCERQDGLPIDGAVHSRVGTVSPQAQDNRECPAFFPRSFLILS
jgi:hypothetical protein